MSRNVPDLFNHVFWHDSELRSLQIIRKGDSDEVHLQVNLQGLNGQELTPTKVVLEDAVFFLSDIDLQGKRECSDQISSAKCATGTDLMNKLRAERLSDSPNALAGYFHFSFRLIPPGGTLDVIAADCTFKKAGLESDNT
jgi:hypothetical protein